MEANALQYAYAAFALCFQIHSVWIRCVCAYRTRSLVSVCVSVCVCICVLVLVRIVSWYALGLNNRSRPLACRVINLLCSIHEHKSTFSECVLLLLFPCSYFTMCLYFYPKFSEINIIFAATLIRFIFHSIAQQSIAMSTNELTLCMTFSNFLFQSMLQP